MIVPHHVARWVDHDGPVLTERELIGVADHHEAQLEIDALVARQGTRLSQHGRLVFLQDKGSCLGPDNDLRPSPGFLPATAFALVAASGNPYSGLWYPVIIAAMTFVIGTLFLRETKNVELMWEMFNLFNTANLADYNGNERATTFRQARSALSPFQAQLGVRFAF